MNLGVVLSGIGKLDEAAAQLRHAVQLRPASPEAHNNLGMTYARQGKPDEALACYGEALGLRPEYPEAHRNRALVRLARGDFEQGWPEYEWRLKCKGSVSSDLPRPRWSGERLDGRTILVHAEQGLGDTLQFIRFAPLVKERGGRVVVVCPDILVRLLSGCAGVDEILPAGAPLPAFDCHAPLMSLPAILGTTLATIPADFPYLSALLPEVERWRSRLGPIRGLKVGIAWQGNPRHLSDRRRSIPLAQFARLAEVPGVRLIALQRGPGREQLEALTGRFPVDDPYDGVQDDAPVDFTETAAMMTHLDLVVTADTALAHLAGALGAKVWVALSQPADWRWLSDREDSPWYPTLRLFRQTRPGDWDETFANRRRLAP